MVTVGCYNNLSEATLRKIEPWANRLAEKKAAGADMGPPRVDGEMTEAQVLLRKIGRAVFSDVVNFAPGTLIPMTGGSGVSGGASAPAPSPMTREEIADGNRRLAQGHQEAMLRMSSIWRQLDVLNGRDA